MSDFLAAMAAGSRARADAVLAQRSLLEASASDAAAAPPLALGSFGVIAEIKRCSPAEGALASAAEDAVPRARQYAEAGAAAISVLTEPLRFGGSLDDLGRVAAAVPNIPVMRKDFIVDPVQILEARAAGAGGVLLIAAIVDEASLGDMTRLALECGMFVLLEAFDPEDLRRIDTVVECHADAAAAGQLLVGINTRDLRTLEVNTNRLRQMAPVLPRTAIAVAESGVLTAEDAATVAVLGYRAALVGTALMRSNAPGELLSAMRDAGAGSQQQQR